CCRQKNPRKSSGKHDLRNAAQISKSSIVVSKYRPASNEKPSILMLDQVFIRQELAKRNLVAFVANDSILPRKSGVSDQPLKNAVPFFSPENLAIQLELPSGKTVKGMGIPEGITLIVGGGYHGKSTLLEALERGVYQHIS